MAERSLLDEARERYLGDFARLEADAHAGRSSWTGALRREALDRFAAAGFPTPRQEEWRKTGILPILKTPFRIEAAGTVNGFTADEIGRYTFEPWECTHLVFINGHYAEKLSRLRPLPSGVVIEPLSAALETRREEIEPHLGRHAGLDGHPFAALNTAFMQDGVFVRIPDGVAVEEPIHLLFITAAGDGPVVSYPRNLIVAGKGSRAAVIESYVGPRHDRYFTDAVTEIVAGEDAAVDHYKLQRESERAFHVGTTEVHQARDSHYVSFSFATGGALSRTNIYTVLDGEGCGATLNGLYMVDGRQHVDHQTRIEHAQPNCFSRELYKGVLDGASHGVFNGKVYVDPIAQKTDGKQTNNVLLLSERAQVDTKPQLEIFADDVKCTHGATVGRIDQTALFYMKSRGINNDLARRLLTYAFAAEVLETIDVESVRQELERATLQRFTGIEVSAAS